MSITYTWKVTGIKTKDVGGNHNAVYQTYWTKTGTDSEGRTGTFTGATPFSTDSIPANNFTPLDQLTEEMVLSWIKPVVVGDYEAHVNAQILKQINQQIAGGKDTELPWKTPE